MTISWDHRIECRDLVEWSYVAGCDEFGESIWYNRQNCVMLCCFVVRVCTPFSPSVPLSFFPRLLSAPFWCRQYSDGRTTLKRTMETRRHTRKTRNHTGRRVYLSSVHATHAFVCVALLTACSMCVLVSFLSLRLRRSTPSQHRNGHQTKKNNPPNKK